MFTLIGKTLTLGGSTGEEIGKYNKLCLIFVTMVWRHIVFDLPVCSTKKFDMATPLKVLFPLSELMTLDMQQGNHL